jgi:hypothetical protein
MKVWIEPLAIGSAGGPRVYILVRQVGRHKDVEEIPEGANDFAAVSYAARRWRVDRAKVEVKPVQVIPLED